MSSGIVEKKETPMERADRISRELISAEQTDRQKKTARLRKKRLELERSDAL